MGYRFSTALGIGLCLISGLADAQGGNDFYAGRQIKMICASDVGGGYDIYARLLARHLGKHVVGKPSVLPINMPGGAGISAASYLAHNAVKDGTALLMIVQTLPIVQVTRKGAARFDLAAFNWIGNMDDSANVFISTRDSGIRTIEDARRSELIVGSTSPNSIGGILPEVSNRLLGTKFNIVNGYKSGEAIDLALQRGEVNGRAGANWSAMKALRGGQFESGEINVFLQAGLRREPDLSDVPLLTDLASNERDATILSFYSGMTALARAIATTPGVPADRIILLRSAFDAAMSDPALLDEAEKSGLQVRPLAGDKLQEIIETMVKISPELLLP